MTTHGFEPEVSSTVGGRPNQLSYDGSKKDNSLKATTKTQGSPEECKKIARLAESNRQFVKTHRQSVGQIKYRVTEVKRILLPGSPDPWHQEEQAL